MYKRTVWEPADRETTPYVWRCSRCGYRKKDLFVHWFFTGMYCVSCVQEVLYDNVRSMKEISRGC